MLRNTKKAFTLAEAVITLVFLSLLAAQLIPAVNTSRPSSEKVLFKKAYSTIENTIANLIGDEKLYPETYMNLTCNGLTQSCQKGFLDTSIGSSSDYLTKWTYYNYHELVDNSKCTNGTKLVRLFCSTLNTTTASCTAKSCSFTTTDGMEWIVTENATAANYTPKCCHSLSGTEPMLTIMVDVNGPAEPNTNTGVNIPDRYHVDVYYNGKIEVNKTLSPKGITFLKNPTNNKRRSDIEDDRFGKD